MEHIAPTSHLIESTSSCRIAITSAYFAGTVVCIAAFARDSMLPEHILADRIESSSTKLAAVAESLITMAD